MLGLKLNHVNKRGASYDKEVNMTIFFSFMIEKFILPQDSNIMTIFNKLLGQYCDDLMKHFWGISWKTMVIPL